MGAISNSEAKYKDGISKRFGGGVMYGGKAAVKLGIDTTVITVGADDIEGGIEELRSLGVEVIRIKRATSNNFSNDYTLNERKLYMRSFMDNPIMPGELNLDLKSYDSVIFIPIYNEFSVDLVSFFHDQIPVLLDPQGFTRRIGGKNVEGNYPVIQSDWKNIFELAQKVDVLKISHEDMRGINFPSGIETDKNKCQFLVKKGFSLVILTRSDKSTIIAGKETETMEIPIIKIADHEAKHQAGAGEVFAVAFMYKFLKTKDPFASVAFGHACAALKITGRDFDPKKAEEVARGGFI